MVLSLVAKELTTGEISAHLAEVYGTSVSKDTISTITDRVWGEIYPPGERQTVPIVVSAPGFRRATTVVELSSGPLDDVSQSAGRRSQRLCQAEGAVAVG